MLRGITLVVLSLTLLGCVECCVVRCDLKTCDLVPAFTRFASGIFNADLVDKNGTALGGIELSVVEKADRNCFRAVFTTVENVGLAQLRVGIFSSADESPPTGRDRFTRRRDFRFPRTTGVSGTEITTLRKGRIDICPEDISVEESKSCCGESLFDLYAYAVVVVNGTRVRAYMKRLEGSTVPCRVPDPKKPFREVCTLEVTCSNNCNTDECSLGEDCVLLDEFSEANCGADSIAVADTQNRQCICKKLDCGTEANCIADRACMDVTIFGRSCPPRLIGQNQNGFCRCIIPCSNVECVMPGSNGQPFSCLSFDEVIELFCSRRDCTNRRNVCIEMTIRVFHMRTFIVDTPA